MNEFHMLNKLTADPCIHKILHVDMVLVKFVNDLQKYLCNPKIC